MVNLLVLLLSGVLNPGVPAPVAGDPYRCGPLPQTVTVNREILFVVDGEVRDESPLDVLPVTRHTFDRATDRYIGEGFHYIQILCHQTFDSVTGEVTEVRGIFWLQTMEDRVESGAKFLLDYLAEFQAGYYERNGQFARQWELPVLFRTHFRGDELALEVTEHGWSATIDYSKTAARQICRMSSEVERPGASSAYFNQTAPSCAPDPEVRLASVQRSARSGGLPW